MTQNTTPAMIVSEHLDYTDHRLVYLACLESVGHRLLNNADTITETRLLYLDALKDLERIVQSKPKLEVTPRTTAQIATPQTATPIVPSDRPPKSYSDPLPNSVCPECKNNTVRQALLYGSDAWLGRPKPDGTRNQKPKYKCNNHWSSGRYVNDPLGCRWAGYDDFDDLIYPHPGMANIVPNQPDDFTPF